MYLSIIYLSVIYLSIYQSSILSILFPSESESFTPVDGSLVWDLTLEWSLGLFSVMGNLDMWIQSPVKVSEIWALSPLSLTKFPLNLQLLLLPSPHKLTVFVCSSGSPFHVGSCWAVLLPHCEGICQCSFLDRAVAGSHVLSNLRLSFVLVEAFVYVCLLSLFFLLLLLISLSVRVCAQHLQRLLCPQTVDLLCLPLLAYSRAVD
jgi:hypothetical protein